MTIKFKAEVGFMNQKVPLSFKTKPVFVCFIAEMSDGHMIEFRRMRYLVLASHWNDVFVHWLTDDSSQCHKAQEWARGSPDG